LGRTTEAAFEYAWALHAFPDHPFAERGMAELLEQSGNVRGAVAKLEALMARTPSPDVAARIGDLRAALGEHVEAEPSYALARTRRAFRPPAPGTAQPLSDRSRSEAARRRPPR